MVAWASLSASHRGFILTSTDIRSWLKPARGPAQLVRGALTGGGTIAQTKKIVNIAACCPRGSGYPRLEVLRDAASHCRILRAADGDEGAPLENQA